MVCHTVCSWRRERLNGGWGQCGQCVAAGRRRRGRDVRGHLAAVGPWRVMRPVGECYSRRVPAWGGTPPPPARSCWGAALPAAASPAGRVQRERPSPPTLSQRLTPDLTAGADPASHGGHHAQRAKVGMDGGGAPPPSPPRHPSPFPPSRHGDAPKAGGDTRLLLLGSLSPVLACYDGRAVAANATRCSSCTAAAHPEQW